MQAANCTCGVGLNHATSTDHALGCVFRGNYPTCPDLLLEVLAKPWLTQDPKWIEKAKQAIIKETK